MPSWLGRSSADRARPLRLRPPPRRGRSTITWDISGRMTNLGLHEPGFEALAHQVESVEDGHDWRAIGDRQTALGNQQDPVLPSNRQGQIGKPGCPGYEPGWLPRS